MSEVMQHVSNFTTGITLSEAARQHVLAYLDKQEGSKGFRLSVKKTGCSGLSYVVDYVLVPQETDIVQPLTEKYQLCIDKASYPYLKGMHIDYVKQGLNHKFIFNNPNEKGQCGCGESFTVEE
ncbi:MULTISPECIES: iron-sulfur cluster assembly accessory protein [unclassified Legionella]|uniref:HesB/IscA family protein n=1 Tax=unclassified Legionella TaxID=2622702 RepID=UPI001056393E|nr:MULTISPECIES: iron-sulfur cluster assembly accessory protein [unclassified Legionella]MDI9817672.1 iron-sulfur cluster assembly accessory protein [Legionella sp. PL877]